jgi:hypothetical protein
MKRFAEFKLITQVLTFGSPKAGTPLMVASPTLAIDLPLKVLAWEDVDGTVWLSYNSSERHFKQHLLLEEKHESNGNWNTEASFAGTTTTVSAEGSPRDVATLSRRQDGAILAA